MVDRITFDFPAGSSDWPTWTRVSTWVYEYFIRKRDSLFKVKKLKRDYQIYVEIRSRRKNKVKK